MIKYGIIIYVLGILWILILFIRSRGQPLFSDEKLSFPVRLFRRSAVYLYRKRLRKKDAENGSSPFFMQREAVRRDLRTLDPSKNAPRKEAEYYIKKQQDLLVFLFAANVIALAASISAQTDKTIREGRYISRRGYGEEAIEIAATEDTYGDFTFSVNEKTYGTVEITVLSEELIGKLPMMIRGENKSLTEVNQKLDLITAAEGYPFKIAWESSRYGLVDSDGTVHAEELTEQDHEEVVLTAVLKYHDERFETQIPVQITGRERGNEEKMYDEILLAIRESEERSRTGDSFALPLEVNGRKLSWRVQNNDMSLYLFLLFAAVGGANYFLSDRRLHSEIDKRNRELSLDYPQVISKIVLFTGAGMSVRNVFYKLGNDYKRSLQNGGRKRCIYEEILLLCNELDSGVSEYYAYTHFGERCRMRQYIKLTSLLTQNLRKGNASLLPALQEEAEHSFEDRKNMARQMGEEAGTKLLLPMVMMLTITLLIIIVPAYYSFSI